eukprot:TRINITY_DN2502_c0_g2_i1.p1 TRINITY_DN2502_c0_g2~~TRINITY_DN2502_c0_g2_i1.p1  ORF type:complete len:216 (-),score=24.12 TRINITY_DN2502_c0_g2_i1:501-1091(-)
MGPLRFREYTPIVRTYLIAASAAWPGLPAEVNELVLQWVDQLQEAWSLCDALSVPTTDGGGGMAPDGGLVFVSRVAVPRVSLWVHPESPTLTCAVDGVLEPHVIYSHEVVILSKGSKPVPSERNTWPEILALGAWRIRRERYAGAVIRHPNRPLDFLELHLDGTATFTRIGEDNLLGRTVIGPQGIKSSWVPIPGV